MTAAASAMRTHQLQGLRGVAALIVAFGHCLGVFATPAWFAYGKDYLNGHAAVVMFFVLSGFVLTLSQHRGGDTPTGFYVKRLFRIYPGWIAACTASLAYLALAHYRLPLPGAGEWWTSRFLASRFHALYIAASYAGALAFLLPQGWTIFVELVAAVLMPAIAYAAGRRRWAFYLGFAVAAVFCLTWGGHTYYGVGSYLVDFFLGAWLATPPKPLLAAVRAATPWSIPSLGVAVVILLSWRVVFPPGAPLDVVAYNNGPTQAVEALCCFWILAVIIHGERTLAFLDSKVLSGLGEVSYSFYLVHVPIMCALAHLAALAPAGPIARSLLLLALTLPASLAASALLYRWVERPGIALGRRLIQRPSPLVA